jgi:hypothetical protein
MDGRIIFKRLVQGICVTVEGIFIWLRRAKWFAFVDTVKNVELIKCRKYLNLLSDYQLFNKNSVP